MQWVKQTDTDNSWLILQGHRLDYESFPEYGAILMAQLDVRALEQEQGADRYCWVFEFDLCKFLLQFEDYSLSCWIEVSRDTDMVKLDALLNQLTA